MKVFVLVFKLFFVLSTEKWIKYFIYVRFNSKLILTRTKTTICDMSYIPYDDIKF